MSQVEPEAMMMSEDETAQDEKLVPVSESIRYRKRAQSAEKRLAVLEQELEKTKSQSQRLTEKLNRIETEQELAGKLTSAGASDLEAALLIAKARLQGQDNADMDNVVEQLKREKGYLFGVANAGGTAGLTKTAGVKQKVPSSQSVLERAAGKAAATGNRGDLQEYLRLRRNFV